MAASFFCARHNQGPAPWESHRKGINSSVRQVQAGFEVGLVFVRSRHCGMFLMWFSFDMLLGCVWCQVALYIYIYKKNFPPPPGTSQTQSEVIGGQGPVFAVNTGKNVLLLWSHTHTHTHTKEKQENGLHSSWNKDLLSGSLGKCSGTCSL